MRFVSLVNYYYYYYYLLYMEGFKSKFYLHKIARSFSFETPCRYESYRYC